jgi:hypothetical protein
MGTALIDTGLCALRRRFIGGDLRFFGNLDRKSCVRPVVPGVTDSFCLHAETWEKG